MVGMRQGAILALGLLAAVLAPVVCAQDDDAEKLFRDMEKKIRGAKAVEVAFTYQLEGRTTKGSLLLTDDKKARLQVRGHFYFGVKDNAMFEVISDGKRIKTKGAKFVRGPNGQVHVVEGEPMEGETTKSYHAAAAAVFSRNGMWASIWALTGWLGEFDPDGQESKMTAYDFRAGAAEKVGERQAKVVHYRCGKGGMDDPPVTVWIDVETGLPLK